MDIKTIAKKKIVGVPVLYLAGASVIILAIVAWKMKPNLTSAVTSGDGTETADGAPDAGGDPNGTTSDPYASLRTNGTVTTAPVDTTNAPGVVTTNEEWLKTATQAIADSTSTTPLDAQQALQAYLNGDKLTSAQQAIVNLAIVKAGQAPDTPAPPTPEVVTDTTNQQWIRNGVTLANAQGLSPSTAVNALTKYIEGEDRSYNEQIFVDRVIKQYGLPPESTTSGGKIGTKPALKQFTNFPGTHTVKGSNDNSLKLLANLYYGLSTAEAINYLHAANPGLPNPGPYAVGTGVKVPAYKTPAYFTTTVAAHTLSVIAKKNGLTNAMILALNPGMSNTPKVGTKVRIR